MARRVSGVYAAGNKLISANRLELVFPSGQVPQNVTHEANLRYSTDKGLSFGNPQKITIGKAGHGEIRAIWWNMGSARDYVFELSISSNGRRDLLEEDFAYEIGGRDADAGLCYIHVVERPRQAVVVSVPSRRGEWPPLTGPGVPNNTIKANASCLYVQSAAGVTTLWFNTLGSGNATGWVVK